MTFTKKGKWLLAIILVVGTVGALLNLVFGQGASNRSFFNSHRCGTSVLCRAKSLEKITTELVILVVF